MKTTRKKREASKATASGKKKLKRRSFWSFFWRCWLLTLPVLLICQTYWVRGFISEYGLQQQRNLDLSEFVSTDCDRIIELIEQHDDSARAQAIEQKLIDMFYLTACNEHILAIHNPSVYLSVLEAIVSVPDGQDKDGNSHSLHYPVSTQLPKDWEKRYLTVSGLCKDRKIPYPDYYFVSREILQGIFGMSDDWFQRILSPWIDDSAYPCLTIPSYGFRITADDVYIDETGTCRLGNCKFWKYNDVQPEETNELLATFDDTPENPDAYTHIQREKPFHISLYGTAPESPTLWPDESNVLSTIYRLIDPQNENGYTIQWYSRKCPMPEEEQMPCLNTYYDETTGEMTTVVEPYTGSKYIINLLVVDDAKWWEVQTLRLYLKFRSINALFVLTMLAAAAAGHFCFRHARRYRQQEQMEYRRTITNSLAHDLKSPLTVISGYAENLCAQTNPEK